MKTLTALILAVAAMFLVPATAPAYEQIRDGSNNLIGTRTRVGDRYEFRDKDNNLAGETRREGSRTVIRDGSGNKIGEVDRGRDD